MRTPGNRVPFSLSPIAAVMAGKLGLWSVGKDSLQPLAVRAQHFGSIAQRTSSASIPGNDDGLVTASCNALELPLTWGYSWGAEIGGQNNRYVTSVHPDVTIGGGVTISGRNSTGTAKNLMARVFCLQASL